MTTAFLAARSIDTEHAVLCRNLGAVQARCSRIFAEQSARIALLEAQLFELRARALLSVTQRAWAAETRLPLLHHPMATAAQTAFRPGWPETNEVLCQVACLSHGGFWLGADKQCLRSGGDCVVQAAEVALRCSSASATEQK